MSPDYFRFRLSSFEARAYLRGMSRRYRAAWEQARYIAYYAAAPHCKDFDADKMVKFPWEDNVSPETLGDDWKEELEALRERVLIRDKMLLK